MEIRFEKATPEDAKTLARISERAFHSDIHCGAKRPGGAAGYDSDQWQALFMATGEYYKILADDRIVGGFFVQVKGHQHSELGRVFVDPTFQNLGIGAQAIELMEKAFSEAKVWTLGTPAWNRRTRHFYSKVGYVEVGEVGPDGVRFEKRLDGNIP